MVKLGIIGGSGAKGVVGALANGTPISSDDLSVGGRSYTVDFLHFTHGETEVYFVLRHGKDHTELPQKLDQRGIISFLKRRSIDGLVLTSATGSLDTSIKLVDEGGIVVNSGVVRGFGYQSASFNDPKNPHAVLANPYDPRLRDLLLDSAKSVTGATAYDGGLYIQNEGNPFESPAEIADLVCRLDAPSFQLAQLKELVALGRTSLQSEVELYERLAKNLNRTNAQVSMNAVRSTILAREAGIPVALASFPVNYGAGLVPAEKVDHERTMKAIDKALAPYIVPFLKNVIEKAPQYLKVA